MFTGLITTMGTIGRVSRGRDGLTFNLKAPFRGLSLGESVSVDGACLTVRSKSRGAFGVHVVDTSLDRTRFGSYRAGQRVNLERALRVGDRVGGHLVQGHVDAVGKVVAVTTRLDARLVDILVPAAVARVTIPMGSIAVDGVSLTVIKVLRRTRVRVSLIPFTLQHTTLERLSQGDEVHIESDMIGKYVLQFVKARMVGAAPERRRRV
jgi:riboflavin synthase